jgi:hypothetical protein
MKRTLSGLIAAMILLCMGTVAAAGSRATAVASAETKGSNLSDGKAAPSATSESAEAANLAARLAAYGRAKKSPLSLAAAAQILADIAVQGKQQQKTDEAGKSVASAAGEAFPDAVALFGEAVALAKEQQNPALADLLDKQSKAAGQTKGRIGGIARHVDTVNADSTDVYRITFRGGEQAVIGAESRYGEDIDIVVQDENQHEICRDTSSDGVPVCIWTPRWTGQFIIKVKNPTHRSVRYSMVTN